MVPDMCRKDGLPSGAKRGANGMRCSWCIVAAFVARPPRSVDHGTVPAVQFGGQGSPLMPSLGVLAKARVRPVGRVRRILAAIHELPVKRCSKPLLMATGRRIEFRLGWRPCPPLICLMRVQAERNE
jgi:hypothetical protein